MRFDSGIAGVVVVLFALMGSIGVGYLLNGNSDYETVNDYTYVTDVSGLYEYTPVTQYSVYSPAQNNYRYSTDLSTIGKYTLGIDYTEAASANLNPILTQESGYVDYPGTIAYDDLDGTMINKVGYLGLSNLVSEKGEIQTTALFKPSMSAKVVPLSDIVNSVGQFSTLTITIPTSSVEMTYSLYGYWDSTSHTDLVTASESFQSIGVAIPSKNSGLSKLIDSKTTAEVATTLVLGYRYPNEPQSLSWSTTNFGTVTATKSNVGTITEFTVNPNGTVTWTYTKDDIKSYASYDVSDIYLVLYQGYVDSISYVRTVYSNVNYLDANYGVTPTGDSVYWQNGMENGAVSWMFSKPSSAASYTFTSHTSTGEVNTWSVSYDSTWNVTYTNTAGKDVTLNLGSMWPAIQVTEWFTGQLQVSQAVAFANFTNYTLSNTQTYSMMNSTNDPLQYYSISKNSGSMRFACTETQIRSGTVVGAMYDATFTMADYFPNLNAVRIQFDSVVFAGASVAVGDWTMTVDSTKLVGTFVVGNSTYSVDLTQPWSLTWNLDGSLDIKFYPVQEAGERTVEILETAPEKVVALNGQWAIDTDLYEVGTHIEEVYDWNFGSWGLQENQFLVCTMALTALISIGFKLAKVPMGPLDLIIIFAANAIIWVIM